MDIHFSRHAKKQMRWRNISEEEVISTLTDPEHIEPSIQGRKNALKRIAQKWVKVTFIEEQGKIIVVTALDKKQ